MNIRDILSPPPPQSVECPDCGRHFRTDALYQEHWYQEHA